MGVPPRVATVHEALFLVGLGVGACSNLGMDHEHCLHAGVPSELFSSVSRGVPQFWTEPGRKALGGVG